MENLLGISSVMEDPLGTNEAESRPLFRAVASSTKQLYQLLKCINFTNKVHVLIGENGIRFVADYARSMQGVAFLDSELFTSYSLSPQRLRGDDGEDVEDQDNRRPPLSRFQISLPALLETLQLFGATEAGKGSGKDAADAYHSNIRNYRPNAFSAQALGMSGTCSFVYQEEGARFSINIEETGLTTTCDLVTYLPQDEDDIPFDQTNIMFKIIMPSRFLLDALTELASSGPERVALVVSHGSPYLSLTSSGTRNLGGTSVDFAKARDVLETFVVDTRWVHSYKFDMIKSATESMRVSTKVSLRGDDQGVLSAQFMVEVEGKESPSFLDFRFVPCIEEDEDEEGGTFSD